MCLPLDLGLRGGDQLGRGVLQEKTGLRKKRQDQMGAWD